MLKAKIADAKGSKKGPVVDMLDEVEEGGEGKGLELETEGAKGKGEVEVPRVVEEGKEGE